MSSFVLALAIATAGVLWQSWVDYHHSFLVYWAIVASFWTMYLVIRHAVRDASTK